MNNFPNSMWACVGLSILIVSCDHIYRASAFVGSRQKLLLISLDGFRHDYIDIARLHGVNTSGFDRVINMGVGILKIENEFTTRTAPNHFSMVTGLHEESHGIVDNAFFDPRLNDSFHLSNNNQASDSAWFDVGGEPIWVTNQRHGHRSGVAFWPGSQAKIKGLLPSVFYPVFNKSLPLRNSLDQALLWLQDDNTNLALVYHSEPDSQGHKTGPLSTELMNVIGELNSDIDYLLRRIVSLQSLNSCLNVIITSDHGMTDVSEDKLIILDDYLPGELYISPGKDVRVLWNLWPRTGITDEAMVARLNNSHPAMNVYLKDSSPDRLFYKHSIRIAPVIVYAQPGWLIAKSHDSYEKLHPKGDHGYDPSSSDMSPFFLAFGPGFAASNHKSPTAPIKLIDLYPMMCHLLGLQHPGSHNGSLDRVAHLLRSRSEQPVPFGTFWDSFTVLLVSCFTGVLGIGLCTVSCIAYWRRRNSYAFSVRRARLKRGATPLAQLHPDSEFGIPDDVRNLIHSLTDEEDVDQMHSTSHFELDDQTLLNMLHEPNAR